MYNLDGRKRHELITCPYCNQQRFARKDRTSDICRQCGCNKRSQYPTATSIQRRAYIDFKHACKQRQIGYTIDLWEYNNIILQPCYICNIQGPNGIDRVNNTLGYIQGNCAPCCKRCNVLKNDMSLDFILQMAKAIISFYERNS